VVVAVVVLLMLLRAKTEVVAAEGRVVQQRLIRQVA
jgi:hypothetical protein